MNHLKAAYHRTRRILARAWLRCMPVGQIAITGSQGKTAVIQMLYTLLRHHAKTVVTDVNLDTLYNVPITALHVTPFTKYALFELGIDTIGEMDKHLEIVSPNVAIVTGISPVHTDAAHLKTLENIVLEKQKMVAALTPSGRAFLNYSDQNVRRMKAVCDAPITWYGKEEDYNREFEENYIGYSSVEVTLEGTSFILHDHASSSLTLRTKLIGTYHAQTLATVYAVMKYLDPRYVINFQSQVNILTPLVGRMSIRSGPCDTIILDDSLRANPASTAEGLRTFAQIPYAKGRKVAIMADMRELEKPEEEHRKIGQIATKLPIDIFVCLGENQRFTAEELRIGISSTRVFWFESVAAGKTFIQQFVKPNDFIYLKGSLYSYVGKVFD